MKKTLTLTTALILTLSLLCAGALASPEPDDIIGTWYLNIMEIEGVAMNPAAFGMDLAMALHEDNTALMQMTGEEDTAGTWAMAGDGIIVTSDGSDIVFTLQDGNLSVDEDGMKMIFGRERAEAEPMVIAPVRTDATLADFDGTWNAYLVDFDDVKLPVEVVGFEAALIIDNGNITITVFGFSIEMEGDVSAGILTATGGDGEDETVSMSYNLHEDGTVSCMYEESFMLYFQKVDE